MRFLINERQYSLLTEGIDQFFQPRQEYGVAGWTYYLTQGNNYNKLPPNSIYAKELFPNVPLPPPKLSQQEVDNLRKGKTSQYNPVVTSAPFDNQGNYKPSIPAPPNGWWALEDQYIKFKEPLGKKDAYVSSKYRSNFQLPPQVNAYYWNSKAGKWVEKNYSNVNEWRNVPAGYHPSEYEAALKWEKDFGVKGKRAGSESTSTYVGGGNFNNPYYNKDYPLGLTRSEAEYVRTQKSQAAANYQKNQKQYDPTAQKVDATYVKNKGEEELHKLYLNDINAINNTFGYYKTEQKEDDFDWFGFLLTVASFIPVTAPFARVASLGYDLAKALLLFEQGNHAEAGLNILFAVLPGVKKTVGNLSAEGLIASGGNMRRLLSNNAEQWYTTVSNSLSRQINGVLPVAVQNYGSEQIISNIIKDNLKKYADDHSVKAVLKNGAKYLDQPSES